MPGPDGPWGDALLAAVRARRGQRSRDRRQDPAAAAPGGPSWRARGSARGDAPGRPAAPGRRLGLVRRLPPPVPSCSATTASCHSAAAELGRLAVLGPNAARAARTGRRQRKSAGRLLPSRPLDGLRAACPASRSHQSGGPGQAGLADRGAGRSAAPRRGWRGGRPTRHPGANPRRVRLRPRQGRPRRRSGRRPGRRARTRDRTPDPARRPPELGRRPGHRRPSGAGDLAPRSSPR